MKRNLLSIIILALLIVNIALTSVMMFSVMGTSQKTSALVDDIASALALDFSDPADETQKEEVPISDIATYKFEDQLTITLKKSEGDGKDHYFVTSVSLSMNTKDKDYKKYGETVGDQPDLLKSIVYEVISSYTLEDLRVDNNADAAAKILTKIQDMYGSQFIFKVNFIDFLYS